MQGEEGGSNSQRAPSKHGAEGFAVNVTLITFSPPTSLIPRALLSGFPQLQVYPAVRRGTTLARPRRLGDPDAGAGRATLTLTRTPQDLPTNFLRSRRRVIPCSSCSRGPSLALVIGAAAASRTQRTELQHIQGQRHTRGASAVVVRVDEHRAPCALIWAGACSIYVNQHAASASAANYDRNSDAKLQL